ncbi:aminomethyltransferase family protein [Engelhardtia mirabilis]|uniref:aminomethyltransferase n=1 Tax=Engelhardtia mirabilis TaxID=2528011 RepID=A0A518BNT3_9BACT|nr:Glycine cleavage system T protein [Planctomycetes bacterium Pla133]QDV02954.1 Glycine cleavage system T protein [Planctomycetes bacterium Pla86]
MQQTAIHDRHVALGARMTDFGGWRMPLQYGPILEEVKTVRSTGGLFDLGHMGRVRVEGPQAVEFLDRVCTARVERIPEGSIRYSLFCTESGDPLDDLLVYRDTDHVYLVVNASNTATDLAWMRQHLEGFDAQIIDETPTTEMLALQGQISQEVLQPLVEDCDLASIGYYKFGYGTVLGQEHTRISRTGYTGEDGFELYLPPELAPTVWDRLLEQGAERGLAPIGLGARDTLRLEAGMALYGHEIAEGLNPIEAGLSFGVSLHKSKSGTLGFDALTAIKAAPTRRLVGITTDGPRVPRQGYKLFDGDDEIGFVCSGGVSPTIDSNIGSAYVALGHDEVGRTLDLDVRGKRQACRVQELPFFSRTRK